MKVQGTDPLARLKDLLARAREADLNAPHDASRASKEGAPDAGDSVEVSRAAQELGQLRDLAAATREVREQLVKELRDEIASGRYDVDGTRIAEEMLREGRELAATPDERAGEF